MIGFNEKALGDILMFQRGFDITKKEQSLGSVPIVSSSGISSYHNQAKVTFPGVVIGRKGTLGTVHYITKDFWPHDTTLWVKDFKGNDPRFIYYFLKTLCLENFDTGSSNPTLNRNHLHKIKVFFPDKNIQQKIAAILSAYDDLIEKNKRRIALLENMAEEIYREWFVRFRFPGYQTAEFEKGIPLGWEVKKLADLSEITSSKRIFLSDYVDEGVPFYRSKEIIERFNGTKPSSPLYISEEKFTQIDERFGSPQENDILITSVGTLGVPCLVRKDERFYFKDGNLIWFKSRNSIYNKFLFFWIQTPLGRGRLLETTIGSSQQAFTIAGLKKVEILMPNNMILEKFMQIWESIREQKEVLSLANFNLQLSKDMLLPRLISGKLSVENLNIQFPPSMQPTAKAE